LKVHVDTVHLGKPGRTAKEKPKVEVDGSTPPKKPRKSKANNNNNMLTTTVEHIVHLLPGDILQAEDHEAGQTHQVMIVDELQLQPHQQQQHYHHILANPRIIQQGVTGPSVVTIPNAFGEFFYTL